MFFKKSPKKGPKKSGKKSSKKARWAKDPQAAREAATYDNPIPSREYIIALLEKAGGPMPEEQMVDALGLDEDDLIAFGRRLGAMVRDGQLVQTRRGTYGLVSKMDLVRGTVTVRKDGWGELETDESEDKIVLHPRTLRGAWTGDTVLVACVGRTRFDEMEGKLVEVLERATTQVVGRFFEQDGVYWVEPEDKTLQEDIIIPAAEKGPAKDGQYVVATITQYPIRRLQARGKVLEVLGDHMAPGMEIDVAIRAHGLPHRWSKDILNACKAFGHEVPQSAFEGRADLRAMPFVTIDGEDAQDFDDAVHCFPGEKGGYRLFVAIADVSHYVMPGSPLDKEAYERGTSVYFPGHVVPMLPEALSNHLCSLKPKTPRLSLVCEMSIDNSGKLGRYRFMRAVIHSHARLTYNQVAKHIDGKPSGIDKDLLPHLDHLYQLFLILHAARRERGAIEFETTETQIVFDKDRKIKKILPRVRNDAHRLIEECMLMANQATAGFLKKSGLPVLYRNHDGPKVDKLNDLRLYLRTLGIGLGGGDKPTPKDYESVLLQIQGRPDADLIQILLLRSMSQAVYAPKNIGHFGLAFKEYTHFTSPIRRYPDLLVHRAIIRAIDKNGTATYPYEADKMVKMGQHCSMTERRADEATWKVVKWLKCEYMLDKLGEEFDGTITSVTHFGIFVQLNKIYVDGLVHISDLKNDYYHHDPATMSLTGEGSGEVFKIGRKVRVQVARVDLDEGYIDFTLVS